MTGISVTIDIREFLEYAAQQASGEGCDPLPEECAQACETPELNVVDGGKCAECEYPFLQKRIENQRKELYDLHQKNERLAKQYQGLQQECAQEHKERLALAVREARRVAEFKQQREGLLQRVEELEKRNVELNREISKRDAARKLSSLQEALRVAEQRPREARENPPSMKPLFYYGFPPL